MNCIIIAGMPASGKTTVAKQIGQVLRLPILEKDAIKEELFDTIGFTCYEEKRQLDITATAILIRVMDALFQGNQSLIVVNNFRDTDSQSLESLFAKYNANVVSLIFKGDSEVFYQRYVDRDLRLERHVGHIVQDHYPLHEGESKVYTMSRSEFTDKFEKLGMANFHLSYPEIVVEATYPEKINIRDLLIKIHSMLECK